MSEKHTADQIAEENRRAMDLPDDRAEPLGEAAPQSREPAAPSEPEKRDIPRGNKFDDKRARIAQKFKESREPKEGEEEFAPVPPDREKVFFGQNTETRSDREARRAAERGEGDPVAETPQQRGEEPSAESPAQTRRRLKVNGREVELSEEEVIAHAQKSLAAGDVLEQAKSLRAEQLSILEELRAAKANQSQPAQPARVQEEQEPVTKPDDAELDQIIDRIQVGDAEEAKQALQKYGEHIERRILDRIGNLDETIAVTMQTVEQANERKRQTLSTLEGFATEYPEFKESKSLQTALAHEAADVMKNHMTELGVRDETLERIKRENGFDDLQTIAYAYRTLREERGYTELPDHAAILRRSGDALRQRFGYRRPEPSPQPHDPSARHERKRDMAPQPRRATAMPSADVQEKSRDEARREAVRQMRMSRRGRA
jgi:hypothetical protein